MKDILLKNMKILYKKAVDKISDYHKQMKWFHTWNGIFLKTFMEDILLRNMIILYTKEVNNCNQNVKESSSYFERLKTYWKLS